MLRARTAVAVAALALAGFAACGSESRDTSAADPETTPTSASSSPEESPTAEATPDGTLSDATGDVWVDGEDVPRPEATVNTDLTGLSATYDGQDLVVTLTYAQPLDPASGEDFYSGFVIDPAPGEGGGKVEILRMQDKPRMILSDSEDAQGSCGTKASDDGAGVITMTVPSECFGSPTTVSVGDAYATSQKEFDGEWVIDTVGTDTAHDGPMIEAAAG